jgi:hypothetical protein
LIKDEEKKVQELHSWVRDWTRAMRIRKFIAALEKEWARQGIDLSAESPKGQRIVWMKAQGKQEEIKWAQPFWSPMFEYVWGSNHHSHHCWQIQPVRILGR